ncbi:MAG: phenylalanine--tRNA ligase subunit alpha [Salibacteraceae bacterium]
MRNKISEHLNDIKNFNASTAQEIEAFRIKYLGSKGILKALFADFKSVANEEKREMGQLINELRAVATSKIDELKASQDSDGIGERFRNIDLSRPGFPFETGSRHPVSLVMNEIIQIFNKMAFSVAEGPEVEDDWHNFTSLNFPEEHPARDMQDTFFVDLPGSIALRTHTSSVQARVMENQKPPIRVIAPGRVYRNEAISARAHCIFHQVEGLVIDENVSFADLKLTLLNFAKEFFGEEARIRLRPSYFPFTEPSAEVDVYWGLKTEADYRITKGTGWLEILGCGMVDPNVLKNFDIDPDKYSGFAFGMGIERIAMLKYQVDDLRLFYENDARFLKQFKETY